MRQELEGALHVLYSMDVEEAADVNRPRNVNGTSMRA